MFNILNQNEGKLTQYEKLNNHILFENSCSVSGSCAHVLAIVYQLEDWLIQGLHDIPDDVSCTSTSQQWHKPRGTKIEPTAVSDMIFAKH